MKKTLSKIFILGAIFFLGVNTTFAENNASDVFYSSFGGSLKMNSDTFALTGKTDGSASNDEFRATFYLQESVNKNSKKELGSFTAKGNESKDFIVEMPASLGNKLVYSDGKLGTITPPYVVYGGLVIEIKRTSDNLFTAVSVPLSAVYKSAGTPVDPRPSSPDNSDPRPSSPDNSDPRPSSPNNSNQNNNDIQNFETLEDPLGGNATIESLLLKLFEIIMYVGIPVVAFFIIWSGFMFVTAQGNAEKLETARQRLLWTIIGAILLLGAWTISQAIKGTVEDIRKGGQTTNSN